MVFEGSQSLGLKLRGVKEAAHSPRQRGPPPAGGSGRAYVAVGGFSAGTDGRMGQAEAGGRVKVGDELLAINGEAVTVESVIAQLKRARRPVVMDFKRPQGQGQAQPRVRVRASEGGGAGSGQHGAVSVL